MKRTILTTLAIIAISFAFTSCKKDWKCTCKTGTGIIIEEASQTYTNVSKKDAKASCDVFSTTYAAPFGGSCSID
ncbi:MAG: hypothetical protein H3C31_10745 [Brumimicrobium sp.]|nr:hypothetical protein [Brumimicrobium sp.]MCO5267549.1 hypothetical protein [Brumimicrobium sp.]